MLPSRLNWTTEQWAIRDSLNCVAANKGGGSMGCFTCKHTGIRCCSQEEQAIKCTICGFCESEVKRKAQKEAAMILLKGDSE